MHVTHTLCNEQDTVCIINTYYLRNNLQVKFSTKPVVRITLIYLIVSNKLYFQGYGKTA